MSRILVYSHDTYGLGNIRRMLAIAMHLAGSVEDASVLVVSGSPMVHGFRIAPQVDYIKLPSVTRTTREGYSTRSLRLDTQDVFELRANLLLAAVADFRPDVILVDKKPFGIRNELESAIYYARTNLPGTALVLVLRDILDEPQATIRTWHEGSYTAAIERFYDRIFVLGSPDVFDPRVEYALPVSVSQKVRFCGYVRRPQSTRHRDAVRREVGVEAAGTLVLVTPGGGQDGDQVLRTYVEALPLIHETDAVKSLIVTGPELAPSTRAEIEDAATRVPGVIVREFTDDMMAYMDAADVVVCMGGYNTICEVATLRKRAVVVPRVRPVEEQWIRAERLARRKVVVMLHPDRLDHVNLSDAVLNELAAPTPTAAGSLDLGALPRVTRDVKTLLRGPRGAEPAFHLALRAGWATRFEASGRYRIN
jgi:predicted glycosyltransferase